MPERRFPLPWSVEEMDPCIMVGDKSGHALDYVYFEEEPGRRAAAHLRRGPADGGEFAKLPELVDD